MPIFRRIRHEKKTDKKRQIIIGQIVMCFFVNFGDFLRIQLKLLIFLIIHVIILMYKFSLFV